MQSCSTAPLISVIRSSGCHLPEQPTPVAGLLPLSNTTILQGISALSSKILAIQAETVDIHINRHLLLGRDQGQHQHFLCVLCKGAPTLHFPSELLWSPGQLFSCSARHPKSSPVSTLLDSVLHPRAGRKEQKQRPGPGKCKRMKRASLGPQSGAQAGEEEASSLLSHTGLSERGCPSQMPKGGALFGKEWRETNQVDKAPTFHLCSRL